MLDDLIPETVNQLNSNIFYVQLLYSTTHHNNYNYNSQSEKLQEVLEEIKQLINSHSSDQQLMQIQKLIEDAQRDKQLSLEALRSILKDAVSKIKVLLTQKENLERQILKKEKELNDKEKQLEQFRQSEMQGAREIQALEKTATSLKEDVSELKQQLLQADQELTTARMKHSNELLEKLIEICALSQQSCQLICEKEALVSKISSKITVIKGLEFSNTVLTQLSTKLQVSISMSLIQCYNKNIHVVFYLQFVAQSGHGTAATGAVNVPDIAAGRTIQV